MVVKERDDRTMESIDLLISWLLLLLEGVFKQEFDQRLGSFFARLLPQVMRVKLALDCCSEL